MLQKRQEGLVDEIVKEREVWDKANPYWIDRKYIKPEGYTETPLYQSIKQLKKEKRRNERLGVGLTAETCHIKDTSKDPGVTFVKSPVVNCQSELNLVRKKQQKEDAKKSEARQENFITMPSRYIERENFIIAEANDQVRERSPAPEGVVRT